MSKKNQPVDVFKNVNMHGGDATVCWEWKGKLNAKDQRPYFTVEGKRRPAYAIALELTSGQAQTNGQVARHSCDNSTCCNPSHLSWGSHQDNMNDMKERERHGLPKIVLRAIHKLLDKNTTHADIAELYGITREAVTKISQRRTEDDG